MKRRQTDFIVGLFAIMAAVAVVFIALRAANLTEVSDEGYAVRVRFENIGALGKRAPVKSGGVKVGQVKAVSFDSDDYVAEVEVLIFAEHLFPADSIFSIVSGNLLGGQYVDIEAGGDDETLANDGSAVVDGNSAIVLEHLIGKFLFDKAGEE